MLLCTFAGDANRQINDLKFKLVKAEQEVTALEQNVRTANMRHSRRHSELHSEGLVTALQIRAY